jgi:hypothetical protein
VQIMRREGTARFLRLAVATAGTVTFAAIFLSAPAFATGDANMTECPGAGSSPGFRSFLPDCRAYELVSPPYGGGQQSEALRAVSPNGEVALAESFGDFAGTENLEQVSAGELGAEYEFSRTSAGWTAEALDPPASEFPRSNFVFASSDLSRSLWLVKVPASSGEEFEVPAGYNGYTLAVREAVGDGKGRFTLVGPMVSPSNESTSREAASRVQGASNDLSHVLVAVRSESRTVWPGDETVEGGQSLYEYVGTGESEPVLVGVSNDGPVAGSPHVNEGADLVSQCGTAFEAVSGSGELVYFTAQNVEGCSGAQPPVSELYVRAGGVSTVDVSEPPLSVPGRECTGVCATDESVPGDRGEGVFQGASADGSKVFFTSTQPLVNSAIGKGNGLYEATVIGEGLEAHVSSLVLLAGEVASVAPVAGEGTRVYFVSESELTTTANANGEKALSGAPNLFVADPGTPGVAFVSREAGGVETTPDGEYAVFGATRDLAGTDDTSTVEQLFEYTAPARAVARVSAGAKGVYECPETKILEEGYNCNGNTHTAANGPTVAEAIPYGTGGFAGFASSPSGASSFLSVVANGTVVFASRLALAPKSIPSRAFGGAGTGSEEGHTENLYEYRAGDVYLVSPGDEVSPLTGTEYNKHRLWGISESEDAIFFKTTDSLVPQDTDTQSSWYDAWIEGGFPAPVTAGGCLGEGCHGAAGLTPALPSPESAVTPGGGNLPPLIAKPVPAPAKPLTRAQKLTKALAGCRRGAKRKRRACEAAARARYGPKLKAKKAMRAVRG